MAREAAAESARSLEPGQRFARQYTIVRLLGAGGMGVVYEAERDGATPHVALKVLHRHLVSNTQVVKRFSREATILRRLSGEHLVPLVDFGEDEDGRLYMALACVDGDALDRLIAVSGLLPVDEAVRITADVCAALTSAHSHGIIHRDLKPANVLLEKLIDGTRRVRVCDFGLAKALRESGVTSSALTDQNMVFGTPEYMSPEQVKGEEVDERADVYAAGVLLFELLTGKPPYLGKTSVATMTAHLTEPIPIASERAKARGITPALDAVAEHALAKAREDRYASADELREALLRAREAPDDPASTKPRRARAQEQLANRDTDLALQRPSIDPLGATAEHPVLSVRVHDDPRPQTMRSPPPSPVTPEALAKAPKPGATPWAWIVVATIAALAGIAAGVFLARR